MSTQKDQDHEEILKLIRSALAGTDPYVTPEWSTVRWLVEQVDRLTATLAAAHQTVERLTLEFEELNQDLVMPCRICRDDDKVKGSVATVCEAHYGKAVHESRELGAAVAMMSDAAYRIDADNLALRAALDNKTKNE